jgi:hypothetical protein
MQIPFGKAVMSDARRSWPPRQAALALLVTFALASCSSTPEQPPVIKVDKPFAAGGSVEMQLEGGNYTVRAGPDDHIRVTFAGNTGSAAADLGIGGTHANLAIKDTPHENFRATVEIPQAADITVHLTAGNLQVDALDGNKDIDSKAGNVEITIPNSGDYGSVDAAVKVGNLSAGPFGDSSSGLSPHLMWSGPGKHTLRVSLGAGNLELKH